MNRKIISFLLVWAILFNPLKGSAEEFCDFNQKGDNNSQLDEVAKEECFENYKEILTVIRENAQKAHEARPPSSLYEPLTSLFPPFILLPIIASYLGVTGFLHYYNHYYRLGPVPGQAQEFKYSFKKTGFCFFGGLLGVLMTCGSSCFLIDKIFKGAPSGFMDEDYDDLPLMYWGWPIRKEVKRAFVLMKLMIREIDKNKRDIIKEEVESICKKISTIPEPENIWGRGNF
jgi:hypothetical protein